MVAASVILEIFWRRRLVVRRPRSTPLQPPVQEFPAWDSCKTVMARRGLVLGRLTKSQIMD